MRKPPKGKSLAETHPEVAKQWHPTKNGNFTAYNFTKGSIKKVWWKCDKADDHEWEATINKRTSGTGCPCCTGQKVVLSNCTTTTHPKIAKQWHPTLNGSLTPYDFTANSGEKVWWKFDKADDHEWQDRITDISNGKNCKVCIGRKVVLSNCLTTTNPELAKQWHPTKNGALTSFDVTEKSYKKVWWKCDKGDDHEWESSINTRVDINWCAICEGRKVVLSHCLATTNPELAKQWHPTLNGSLTPYDFTANSGKKVWWKCDKADDHEWEVSVNNRSRGTDCPICDNAKVVTSNSLATTHPEIAKQWHPTLNGSLTPLDIVIYSNKKIWWQCDKVDDHFYESSPYQILKGAGCRVCSGRTVVNSNCLATMDPDVAKQWHPTKNGDLTPYDVTVNSGKKVWWKCPKGVDHEWEASPNSKLGCPICSNQKIVTSNSLATTHPEIAKQWHPTLNGDLTPLDVSAGSNKKLWWKCNKADDHEWKTSAGKRLIGRSCPYCTLTPQSKQELTITFELMKLFKNINPKGLKTKL
jgi:cytochrome c-type biogenesis protein CcmH/NrfF